jgi:NADPH-dependent 2,4-dienoyl-CoA reductase/sulfur reductase-like enzyme
VLAARPASNGEDITTLTHFFPVRFDEHFLARSIPSIMSPGMDNEGFVDVPDHDGNTEMTYGVNGNTADHVIVVGAGPAGLMLA